LLWEEHWSFGGRCVGHQGVSYCGDLLSSDLRYWMGWDDRPSDWTLRKTEVQRPCIECWRAVIDGLLDDLRYQNRRIDRSDWMLRKTEVQRPCIECWRAVIGGLLGDLRYKNRRIGRSDWAWGEPELQRYWSEPWLVTSGLAMEHSGLTGGTISR
jgi:hypothetical protein